MNHLLQIQKEFVKFANWSDLSKKQQRAYLKKHRKSKKHVTSLPYAPKQKSKSPEDFNVFTLQELNNYRENCDLAKTYGINQKDIDDNVLPNNDWGFILWKNQGTLLPKWKKIADKYDLKNLMSRRRQLKEALNEPDLSKEQQANIKSEKHELKLMFDVSMHELRKSITSLEAKHVLVSMGEQLKDNNIRQILVDISRKVDAAKIINVARDVLPFLNTVKSLAKW
jgi:hypothetical protein